MSARQRQYPKVLQVIPQMDFAMHTHPCRQPSYTKKRQVLAEEEEEKFKNCILPSELS